MSVDAGNAIAEYRELLSEANHSLVIARAHCTDLKAEKDELEQKLAQAVTEAAELRAQLPAPEPATQA